MKWHSIKTRLFIVISIFVVLILIAVALSWYSLSRLQENQSSVISRSIPPLIDTTTLIKHGGQFSRHASRILSANTKLELETAGEALDQTTQRLANTLHNAKLLLARNKREQSVEIIGHIDQLTERMAEIIVMFKDFSRKSDSRIGAVKLGDALDSALSLLDNRFNSEQIRVKLQPFDRHTRVMAELVRLEQVLVNVISNAIDAMSGSEIRQLDIQIKPCRENDLVDIVISDSGCGIDQVQQAQIFEPFFTTNKTGQGLGLGLSISYNIIKDFGGHLSCQSQPDIGSEFNIQLRYSGNHQLS